MSSRSIVAISVLACACTDRVSLGEIDTSGGTTMVETSGSETTDNNPPAAVDILFVMDNSGSMGEEQANVQSAIGALVTALETTSLDYRIAVTTTDKGNPKCGDTRAEAGNFVFSSCRERLHEFLFPGADPPLDRQAACTESCTLESVSTTNGVPWIENAGSNLPEGVSVEDALRCILPQGINGCGFESTLENMHVAIIRSFTEGEDEFGFIRRDAHLMVVLVSDETDCSLNEDWGIIFFPDTEGGNEVFWSLPDEPSPTSAVCWNAGVSCTGGPGVYDDCHPVDKDVNGSPTTDPNAAVLHPLSRYQMLIDDVRATKAASHGQVFLFGLLGVPEDYPSTRTIVYRDGEDPRVVEDFGIGFGCEAGENARGVPPVRERALLENNAVGESSPIHSICAAEYDTAFTAAIAQIGAYVGP